MCVHVRNLMSMLHDVCEWMCVCVCVCMSIHVKA